MFWWFIMPSVTGGEYSVVAQEDGGPLVQYLINQCIRCGRIPACHDAEDY